MRRAACMFYVSFPGGNLRSWLGSSLDGGRFAIFNPPVWRSSCGWHLGVGNSLVSQLDG